MSTITFKQALDTEQMLIAPGVPDTLSTLLAEQFGFRAVFLSGSAMSATHLGLPDIGLMTAEEVATIMRQIRERSNLPVLIDADSGFGNAYSVARTVRTFELAGASAIQIEDMVNDKHPEEVTKRPVIPLADMCSKLKAALDARHNESTLISARTDVNVTEDINAVSERIHAFIECGVDMVFAEGLASASERQKISDEVGGRVPIIYNTIWPAQDSPTFAQLEQQGFSIALAPKTIVAGMVSGVKDALLELRELSNMNGEHSSPNDIADALKSDDYLARYKNWVK